MKYIIAIDGGGSKTQGAIYQAESAELNQSVSADIQDNHSSLPLSKLTLEGSSLTASFERAEQVIAQMINQLLNDLSPTELVVSVGVAGAGNDSLAKRLHHSITEHCRQNKLPMTHCLVMEDCVSALFGAAFSNGFSDTTLITLGTGSFVAHFRDLPMAGKNQLIFKGGWGFPIGDEGGGARLGQEAVRQYLQVLDSSLISDSFTTTNNSDTSNTSAIHQTTGQVLGQTKDQTLSQTMGQAMSQSTLQALGQKVGTNKEAILTWLSHAKQADYAALAKLIVKKKHSCKFAAKAWQWHIEQVKDMLVEAKTQPDSKPQVVFLTGGLAKATAEDIQEEWLIQHNIKIKTLAEPSLFGAFVLGANSLAADAMDAGCSSAEAFSRSIISLSPSTSALSSTSNDNIIDSVDVASGPASAGDSKPLAEPLLSPTLTPINQLVSESRNQSSMSLDTMNSVEVVSLMNQQDSQITNAIALIRDDIARAVDIIKTRLEQGGRLIYMGAGTSGRLGVLDAVECPPTFSIQDNVVIGLLAGGEGAMFKAVEGAEDSEALGRKDLENINLTERDVVVGIAASGRTPYVIGGIQYAKQQKVMTISVTCNPKATINELADVALAVNVGPEVLTGSTRLKAGTAQKLILNMLTTGSFVQLGKCYENLMVDVNVSNVKLKQRALRIIQEATQCSAEQAEDYLNRANNKVKPAILMFLAQMDLAQANDLLSEHDGKLKLALAAAKAGV